MREMMPPPQQRPPNMNVAQNANRNSMNVNPMNGPAGYKIPSQLTMSKVSTRPANGGPIQSTQVRQQQTPPPSQQGQMVAQNRQPSQNQLAAQNAALHQMQSRGIMVKKQIRKSFFCPQFSFSFGKKLKRYFFCIFCPIFD